MKKTLLNIAERAGSMFLFTYISSSAVLAGGFGTHTDLKIAGSAALMSLAKNVLAALTVAGNGPGVVGFDDGGADVVVADQPDPGVIPA